jgi:hypothetical protein
VLEVSTLAWVATVGAIAALFAIDLLVAGSLRDHGAEPAVRPR